MAAVAQRLGASVTGKTPTPKPEILTSKPTLETKTQGSGGGRAGLGTCVTPALQAKPYTPTVSL